MKKDKANKMDWDKIPCLENFVWQQ